jgi:hypothetical protein
MSENKFHPFSSGSQAGDWEIRNCMKCNKKATLNLQENWSLFRIQNDEFIRIKEWNGGVNEFWCDECYEKECGLE